MASPLNNTNATNSTSNQGNGFNFWKDPEYAIAWLFLIPIALACNIFVIRTVFKVPKMKSPVNILFVNMALCDILTALTMIPLQCVQYFQRSHEWRISGTLGIVSCKTVLFVGYINISGSIFALTLMAIDRYFAICRPIRKVMFFKRYKIVSAMVWVPAIIFMLPIAVFANTSYSANGSRECVLEYSSPSWKMLFMSELFVLLYMVPLVILAVLYGIIAKELWFNKTSQLFPSEDEKMQKRERKQRKVVKMLMIVLGVFAACWLPVQVFHLFSATSDESSLNKTFIMFAIWLAHANSAINPILCITLHSGFRKAFKDCFYKCGCPVKKPVQDEELRQRPGTTRSTSLTTTIKI